MLGDGFAVELTSGRILSPADGTIEAAFDTGHAVGIRTENGMEILIHIGINTVELGGKGFRLHVSQGQKVRRGDCLVDVDLEEVRKSGKDQMCIRDRLHGAAPPPCPCPVKYPAGVIDIRVIFLYSVVGVTEAQ